MPAWVIRIDIAGSLVIRGAGTRVIMIDTLEAVHLDNSKQFLNMT